MYISICVCIYVCTYIYVYVCMFLCIYAYKYICIFVCMYYVSYHLHVPTVLKSGSINLLETLGLIQACNGITLPLCMYLCTYIYIYIYISKNVGRYYVFMYSMYVRMHMYIRKF